MKRCIVLIALVLPIKVRTPVKWDNSKVMEEILALRHELAQLLGFENYAFKSLATKMAENPQQVPGFLNRSGKTRAPARRKELQ